MANDIKDVEVLQIIKEALLELGTEYVELEEIVHRIPYGNRTYSFGILLALEELGVIEASPSDRHSYKIVGSIKKWKPKYPDNWDYDEGRIAEWLNGWKP